MKSRITLSLMVLLMMGNVFSRMEAKSGMLQLSSPDGQVKMHIVINGTRLSYDVVYAGTQVIRTSPLGVTVDGIDLGENAVITAKPRKTIVNGRYALMGNHTIVVNRANEWMIPLVANGKKYNLITRIYDDGIAIRYTLPTGAKHIDGEMTSWTMVPSVSEVAWSDFSECYENLSHVTALDKIPQNTTLMGPLTIKTSACFLSISEADCEAFPDMAFKRDGNTFRPYFYAAKDGWDVSSSTGEPVPALNGSYRGFTVTPWRTVIIAKDLTKLVNSDLLTNVCPAPIAKDDFSWVKPGRCLWQWWSIGAPKQEDQKNWYDAAVKLKWEYYLIDEGWRDWQQPGKDNWTLLKEAIDYGKSVGIKTIVWVDSKEFRHAKERRAYLEKVKAAGAVGIKIDFIPNATADIMRWYMGGMQDCAELKLLLNFHGSVKPTGLRRTYPNDITREAVRGDEWHMSRYNRVIPYTQDVSLPFTRLMAGPADVTPVMLNPKELATADYTWAHEFAQAIMYLSPITHFCDYYQYYLDSPMFDLFQQIPTVWDETRVLDCTEMGKVVAYARRKGGTWWIGVMNGADEKEITIKTSFIKKRGHATLVYDNSQSKTSIDRRETSVSPNDVLTLRMARGGGAVIVIRQ